MPQPSPEAIEAAILAQTTARGAAKSICPREVARALVGESGPWQPLMSPVRHAALKLQAAGEIEILRKGRPVPAEEVRGVIRLRRREGDSE